MSMSLRRKTRPLWYWIAASFIAITVFIFGLIGAAKPAYASSLTCANVRCATGSCVDTPGGPLCGQPQVTCANMLCVQGTTCEMQSSGPKCVPVGSDYVHPRHCKWGEIFVNGQTKCRKNPYRKQLRKWKKRNQHFINHHHVGDYCRHWSHDNRRHWERRDPRPEPTPVPTEPRMCPMYYDPICGEKPVQCFKAPCHTQKKTFGNSCQMQYTGYRFLHRGVCR